MAVGSSRNSSACRGAEESTVCDQKLSGVNEAAHACLRLAGGAMMLDCLELPLFGLQRLCQQLFGVLSLSQPNPCKKDLGPE